MRTWISLDGTDGAGKSSLARELIGMMPGYTILERDSACESLPESHAGIRLRQLRETVFGYDHAEPVWEYPTRYWLHVLCSFFWLYHHEVISTADGNVLTDGWATKHWARFLLHEDTNLVAEANASFGALPWPQQILVLPRDAHQGTVRETKPSERGAFDPHSTSFDQYQDRTLSGFDRVQQLLSGRVQFKVLSDATPSAVLQAAS